MSPWVPCVRDRADVAECTAAAVDVVAVSLATAQRARAVGVD